MHLRADIQKEMITVMEIMGRNAGWLTGAAALAKTEECEGWDLIYLPEIAFDVEDFLAKVKELLQKKSSIVIAVSEGIKLADGRYVCELSGGGDYVDAFGHKQLQGTAAYLAGFLGAEIGCKTRSVEFLYTAKKCFSYGIQSRYRRSIYGRRSSSKKRQTKDTMEIWW